MIIESRMGEVRLVFIASLSALVVATLAMLFALADTVNVITASMIFASFGWHAAKSDEGTVRLYERYTGLEVSDRWSSDNMWNKLWDLVLPYGYTMSGSKVERLHGWRVCQWPRGAVALTQVRNVGL